MIRVEVRCKKHPHYMGQREPQVECQGCDLVYTLARRVLGDKQAFPAAIAVNINDKAVY